MESGVMADRKPKISIRPVGPTRNGAVDAARATAAGGLRCAAAAAGRAGADGLPSVGGSDMRLKRFQVRNGAMGPAPAVIVRDAVAAGAVASALAPPPRSYM